MPRALAWLRVVFGIHELKPIQEEPFMRNLIISGVKTAVQVGVAALVAWLASLGVDVAGEAAEALEAGLFAVSVGVVAVVLNWAGERWPIVNRLISLGISNQTANYTE